MFEPIVQAIVDQKNAQFELDLSGWIGHSKLDQVLDGILGIFLLGVLVYGGYNLATFSLGSQ